MEVVVPPFFVCLSLKEVFFLVPLLGFGFSFFTSEPLNHSINIISKKSVLTKNDTHTQYTKRPDDCHYYKVSNGLEDNMFEC